RPGGGAGRDERAQRAVTRVALKGLAGRKLRSALTALAIVLGVAMISGTFILTDTINKGFKTIFTESYRNTSAVITAHSAISSSNSGAALTSGFPASVLDKAVAGKQHFHVGDTVRITARGPERPFRLSGIVKFGTVSSIGSATIAVFDLPTAQRLFNKQGKLDIVRVAAKNGVSDAKLAAEIRPILPRTAQVRTVSAQVKQET